MMKRKLLNYCLAPLRAVLANPVVVRDLRAQMRGTKSYWFQGAYLVLLGILAISGYAQATGQTLASLHSVDSAGRVSIIEAQGRLESFYYFIFLTLAALIALIAPALTAGAVIGERQRQSLDLLITTPLTAGELLIGKMLSSIAFLGLLLCLSLPASALCVLLGGATLSDVFRIYALLAIDGVVLAAIGLFFSCASRTSLLALVWTYLTVAAVVVGTGMLYMHGVSGGDSNISYVGALSPLVSITALNPFVAVLPAGQISWSMGSVSIPVWIGTAVAAVLLVRLLITAATYRLGAHGGESGPSLRRQVLLLSGLGMFFTVYSIVKSTDPTNSVHRIGGIAINAETMAFALLIAFLTAVPFLPGLFVPVSAEDAPPGTSEQSAVSDTSLYRPGRALLPEHAGALPFFHLLTLVLTAAALIAFRAAVGVSPFSVPAGVSASVVGLVLSAAFHINGLGFCFWAIARFAAGVMPGVTQARSLAFGIFALLCALPIMVLPLIPQSNIWHNEPATMLWLLYPFVNTGESRGPLFISMLVCGLQGFAWGFAFILAEIRWHRTTVTAIA
jgi:ABC-type transport system involved in multi-copper enzyme maturation permease subunit